MKADLYEVRVKAFIKRLLQNAINGEPPFIISTLLLISRLLTAKPGIKSIF